MISPGLTDIATELQQAAERRDYLRVQQLARKAGVAAAREARAFPPGDPGVQQIAGWLEQLYRSTEIQVRIGRAVLADEFRRRLFLKRYLSPPERQAPRVRLAL